MDFNDEDFIENLHLFKDYRISE